MKKVKKTENGQNIMLTDKRNQNENMMTDNKTENGNYSDIGFMNDRISCWCWEKNPDHQDKYKI